MATINKQIIMKKQVTFNLEELTVKDLNGVEHPMSVDKADFGNTLYLIGSKTIEMDEIAKTIHKEGKVTANFEDIAQIPDVIESLNSYTRRFKEAVREYVERLEEAVKDK